MKWISVDEKLPDNNSYVLVHLLNQPWLDSDDPAQVGSEVYFGEYPIKEEYAIK